VHEFWFLLRHAVKISAVAAANNFGWLSGALSVFRRQRRRMIPAGGGGAIQRLRGLPYANTYVQYGIQKLTPSACSHRSRVPDKRRVPDTGRGSRQIVLIEAGGFYPGIYGSLLRSAYSNTAAVASCSRLSQYVNRELGKKNKYLCP